MSPDISFLFWITLLVPLVMALIDLFQGAFRRTPVNLALAFLVHLWRIYGMLLIQFTFIPLAFALFPAGFLLQLIGLVDLGMRQIGRYAGESPVLCMWANVEPVMCAPALWGFHLGHVALVAFAILYGERLFNKTADWYAVSLKWLVARLTK